MSDNGCHDGAASSQLPSTDEAREPLSRIAGMPGGNIELEIGEAPQPFEGGVATPLKIAIRTEGKILFIDPADVTAVEAQGNYVLLQTRCGSHLLRESVSTVARKLERYGFIRIHRSTIVNGALVEEVQVSGSGEMLLHLKGAEKQYNISRKYKGVLKAIAPCWI